MLKLAITALSVLITVTISAQPGRLFDQQLKIHQMNVRVTSDCFTATTFIEMEFYNNKDQEVEGAWFFNLKRGQVITSLQLDLHGKYRDGSIEERWKATNAYNTIVGKRVDPALLQSLGGDAYKLSIYPVPAKSSRKITMTILQLLTEENNMLVYDLPIHGADSIARLNVSIRTGNCYSRPLATSAFLANDVFSAFQKHYELTREQKKVKLPIDLSFAIPTRGESIVRVKEAGGKKYFALRFTPQPNTLTPVAAQHLKVYWDVSLSAANRDKYKDIAFLENYIARQQLQSITVVPFTTKKGVPVRFSSNAVGQLKKYLQNLRFEGGTSFDDLDFRSSPGEVTLLFSDGKRTIASVAPQEIQSPVFTISSSFDPDSNFLKQLTGKGGGRFIDLYRLGMSEALAKTASLRSGLLDIATLAGNADFRVVRKDNSPVLVYGTFKENDNILVRYGTSDAIGTDSYSLNGDMDETSAIDRIDMLLQYPVMTTNNDWNAVLEFGLAEKVVTARTSFIVLERVEDYVRYNITPPKELEEECRAQGFVKRSTKEMREQQKLKEEYNKMLYVVNEYSRLLIDFGETVFPVTITEDDYQEHVRVVKETKNGEANEQVMLLESPVSDKADLESVVVTTAYGIQRNNKEIAYATTKVSGRELTRSNAVNVQSGLTGKVSGLNVTTINNGVLEETRLTLRGIRSLTGNNQPLLVYDGSVVPLGYINQLNPNDIQDINILKGATAATLYGSEGVNGVIVVTSKKYRGGSSWKSYRLCDMPEEEYMQQLINAHSTLKLEEYAALKKIHRFRSVFFVEAAQHLFAEGFKEKAKEVLWNASELPEADASVMRAIAYVLEGWGEYEEAISIYLQLPLNTQDAVRDLAWCYYQAGRVQEAVDHLYEFISSGNLYYTQKALLVDDMNAMIAINKGIVTTRIPKELLMAKPVDLRIVVSSNTYNLNGFNVSGPSSTPASRLNHMNVYQVKKASEGKHKVSVNHYDQGSSTRPLMVKMLIFKNFGKPDQTIKMETFIMNNQWGAVEISEVKWK